jgi:hypothetical protein
MCFDIDLYGISLVMNIFNIEVKCTLLYIADKKSREIFPAFSKREEYYKFPRSVTTKLRPGELMPEENVR